MGIFLNGLVGMLLRGKTVSDAEGAPVFRRRLQGLKVGSASGFTLIELLIATFISALVIGIMAVSLNFTMRVWERNQYQAPDTGAQLLDLLKWQLGALYPFHLSYDGKKQILFEPGDGSLAFATSYSIRAISKGAPVIARYVFDQEEKKVFYSEMPIDPYHSDRIDEFLKLSPEEKKEDEEGVHFYGVSCEEWEITYWDPDQDDFGDDWESTKGPPSMVQIISRWEEDGDEVVRQIAPGFILYEENKES